MEYGSRGRHYDDYDGPGPGMYFPPHPTNSFVLPPPEKMCSKYKTEMCKFYAQRQTCPHYETCAFAHGEKEKRRNPISPFSIDYRPVLNVDAPAPEPENCLNANEYHYHPEVYKTKACASVQKGLPCTRIFCARAHYPEELRPATILNTVPYFARYRDWRQVMMMVQRDPKSVEMIYEFTQETALHYAAKYANRDVVALLLEMKASVNARDILGQTPLHKLAAYNAPYCVEAAKLLLHAGAKLEAEDVYQSTAITYALRNRNEDLLRILRPDYQYQESTSATPPPTIQESVLLPVSHPGQVVKCKFGDIIKMIKVPEDSSAFDIIQQVGTKFEKESIAGFLLKYHDEEGNQLDLGDEEDVRIFLDNPKIKKVIVLHEI